MIVIICAKYKKNPSRTVDATERTWFSRPNDLEDIGQGQGPSHATHPLMLLIICTKYGKNPSWTVDATGRTRKVNGQTERQTDGQTDGQTDRQTGWIQYTPPNFVVGGITNISNCKGVCSKRNCNDFTDINLSCQVDESWLNMPRQSFLLHFTIRPVWMQHTDSEYRNTNRSVLIATQLLSKPTVK